MTKITSGTKEWADTNVNLYHGCSNNCSYCYAKKMAIRFGRKTEDTWRYMVLNEKAFRKGYGKRKGRIMFPTSHDITPDTYGMCSSVLRKLLRAGNDVLITTKPSLSCVEDICKEFKPYKDLIQFRFTITSQNDETLKKFEPGAPLYLERMEALIHAFNEGWKTSVSIEPFLDMSPIPLIFCVSLYSTESIWVGKLNYMQTKFNTKENVKQVVNDIGRIPAPILEKVRLKDSIRDLW